MSNVAMKPDERFVEESRKIIAFWKKDPWPEQLVLDVASALSNSYDQGRRAGLEEAIKDVEAEPELPGDMPDEMWTAIRNDRDACQESHKITVRGTKTNIVQAVRQRISKGEGV